MQEERGQERQPVITPGLIGNEAESLHGGVERVKCGNADQRYNHRHRPCHPRHTGALLLVELNRQAEVAGNGLPVLVRLGIGPAFGLGDPLCFDHGKGLDLLGRHLAAVDFPQNVRRRFERRKQGGLARVKPGKTASLAGIQRQSTLGHVDMDLVHRLAANGAGHAVRDVRGIIL